MVIVELLVGISLALVGANFAYFVAWKNLVTLFAYKPKAITSAQIGEKIYVAGKLAGRASQYSPLTKTPCVSWRIIVTETKSKNSTLTLLDEESKEHFMVSDRSGMVEVQSLSHKRPLIKLGNDSFFFSTYNFSAHDFVGLGQPTVSLHQNIAAKEKVRT
ncbi:hypothetical protein Lepto7376_0360 [[Leptolyngbya] sp. PCC 7376]|uniref:hypothetical protein n=1 Tax=[Leptolyngbya] sp. PCC 7376 TaxID=111781 RepID=UPI00029EE28D|nr:hypothetical protein [[Leptolyngbya] sp. PCC 7376]AFY36799.1 hypothetical protein Lepto7376_0360 [[Leptolyngbya] sp. PCC 7376]